MTGVTPQTRESHRFGVPTCTACPATCRHGGCRTLVRILAFVPTDITSDAFTRTNVGHELPRLIREDNAESAWAALAKLGGTPLHTPKPPAVICTATPHHTHRRRQYTSPRLEKSSPDLLPSAPFPHCIRQQRNPWTNVAVVDTPSAPMA